MEIVATVRMQIGMIRISMAGYTARAVMAAIIIRRIEMAVFIIKKADI